MKAAQSELAKRLMQDPVARQQLRRVLTNQPPYGQSRQIVDSAGNKYQVTIK